MPDTTSNRSHSVLLIPMYDERWASSRYRVYNYIPYLQSLGMRSKVVQPPDRHFLDRIIYLISILCHARQADIVFIQKKIFKKGFLCLLHKLNPHIVFDMDDAIFARPTSVPPREFNEGRIRSNLKFLLQKCQKVFVGNNFLKQYVLQFNPNVCVIPTPILTEQSTLVKNRTPEKMIIGWIGNRENLIYLYDIAEVIRKLNRNFKNRLILKVICDEEFELNEVDIINVKWSMHGESEALMGIDIGIMPLRDDKWSRGKCSFKILQFMSFSIPVVASPVGMNAEVIDHGVNGFLADTDEEWFQYLLKLINNDELREKLGSAGREFVLSRYTYEVTAPMIIRAFNECLE